VLGADVIMAGGSMLAGSTTIGDRCVLAGSVKFSGHLKVADDVRLGGGTVVLKDIRRAGDYMGHPLMEKRQFIRLLRKLRQLVEKTDPAAGSGD
jgi:UDP-3-O-[3-hydroxymyristoyl] glucosamine N-acyltransferase